MAENIITNANDVELLLQSGDMQRGTAQSMGRIVVSDFSITKEDDSETVSGVGMSLPAGLTNGDITHSFSFTIQGDDVDVFQMVSQADGHGNIFSFSARKREDETLVWEYALGTCKATTEEISGSSGDPMEYSVEGIAVSVDKQGVTADGSSAWD